MSRPSHRVGRNNRNNNSLKSKKQNQNHAPPKDPNLYQVRMENKTFCRLN